MSYYKTLKELKELLKHFRTYDVKEPEIKITRYGKGDIGRIRLIRGGKTSIVYETKEYTMKAINNFIAKELKETQELPY